MQRLLSMFRFDSYWMLHIFCAQCFMDVAHCLAQAFLRAVLPELRGVFPWEPVESVLNSEGFFLENHGCWTQRGFPWEPWMLHTFLRRLFFITTFWWGCRLWSASRTRFSRFLLNRFPGFLSRSIFSARWRAHIRVGEHCCLQNTDRKQTKQNSREVQVLLQDRIMAHYKCSGPARVLASVIKQRLNVSYCWSEDDPRSFPSEW